MLTHAGKISADMAKAKVELEYARYHAQQDALPRAVDAELEKAARQLQKSRPPREKKSKKP